MNTYRIIPLALSDVFEVPCASFYYKAYVGDPVTLRYGCFCLRCNETGELMMVDTGLASQEDMEKYNYPFRRLKNAPTLKSVMAEKGLDPGKVTTVMFTHLHQDHCFNLELFTNAKFYVQKKELAHAATPTPVEYKSYQKYDCVGLPAWARVFGRIVTLEGDRPIADGIRVMLTPGHTPGSQTVVVNTKKGIYYLTGDNFYYESQLIEGRMNGNFTDLEGWYISRDRILDELKRTGGKMLSVHDPATYEQEYFG